MHKMTLLKTKTVRGHRYTKGEIVTVSKWTRRAYLSSGFAEDTSDDKGGHSIVLGKLRKLRGRKRFAEAKQLIKSQSGAVVTSWEMMDEAMVKHFGEGFDAAAPVPGKIKTKTKETKETKET